MEITRENTGRLGWREIERRVSEHMPRPWERRRENPSKRWWEKQRKENDETCLEVVYVISADGRGRDGRNIHLRVLQRLPRTAMGNGEEVMGTGGSHMTPDEKTKWTCRGCRSQTTCRVVVLKGLDLAGFVLV